MNMLMETYYVAVALFYYLPHFACRALNNIPGGLGNDLNQLEGDEMVLIQSSSRHNLV